jgi:hypothetical protein
VTPAAPAMPITTTTTTTTTLAVVLTAGGSLARSLAWFVVCCARGGRYGSLWAALVIVEHAALLVRLMLTRLFPETPEWLRHQKHNRELFRK